MVFGQMFQHTMSVTNPLGQTYHGGDSTSAGSGSFLPWGLTFQLNDFQRSTEAVLHGGFFAGSPYRTAGDIREASFSGPTLWYETGYWTYAQIPEPSTAAFLALLQYCGFHDGRNEGNSVPVGGSGAVHDA